MPAAGFHAPNGCSGDFGLFPIQKAYKPEFTLYSWKGLALGLRKKLKEKLFHAKERIKKNKIGKVAVEKLGTAKKEPRIPALLIMEFFLSMVLVLATIVYLDPGMRLMLEQKYHFSVVWPYNILIFLVILGIVIYLYGFSKAFREEYREFFEIKKRW